jgi:hypothetical protein
VESEWVVERVFESEMTLGDADMKRMVLRRGMHVEVHGTAVVSGL